MVQSQVTLNWSLLCQVFSAKRIAIRDIFMNLHLNTKFCFYNKWNEIVYFFNFGWCRNRNDKILLYTKGLNQYSKRYIHIWVNCWNIFHEVQHLGNYRKLLLNWLTCTFCECNIRFPIALSQKVVSQWCSFLQLDHSSAFVYIFTPSYLLFSPQGGHIVYIVYSLFIRNILPSTKITNSNIWLKIHCLYRDTTVFWPTWSCFLFVLTLLS